MKRIIITTERVMNGTGDNWHISYLNSQKEAVQTILVLHGASVGGEELRYALWEDVLKHFPKEPHIPNEGTRGILTFDDKEQKWDVKPLD